jgi:hypothetical protein
MGGIAQRIKEANGRLKANCFGVTLNQLVAGSIPSSPISFQRFQDLTLTRYCLNRRNILHDKLTLWSRS